jgi:hypothetical protein
MTAKHRSSIYRSLSPLIGEEEAEALLSHIPAGELDEPVTKDFLRAELAELEARINDRFRQQTIWMCTLSTTLVGIVALVS